MSGPDRRTRSRVLVQVLLVVAVFAAAGAAGGWLWFRLWDVPPGVAFQGEWVPQPGDEGLAAAFDGTALYVVVGFVGGVVLGVLAALLARRSELATLLAVVVGAVVAGWLAHRVGVSLSPPDPAPLARTAEDLTPLDGNLEISGRSPYVAWPLGGLLGLGVVYLLGVGAREVRRREDDPTWLPAPGNRSARPGVGEAGVGPADAG